MNGGCEGMTMANNERESRDERQDRVFEMVCGVILAFLAALLAITDLMGGRFADDQSYAESEKTSAFSWYQAKSIKQSLAEGQADTLRALLAAGTVRADQVGAVSTVLTELDQKVARYNKEKNEILEGSDKVGRENWAQDVSGEMGKVIGANEWQAKERALGKVGDIFDMATLFLQLSLVMGAIAIVFQHAFARRLFFFSMCLLGIVGIVISAVAANQGFGVG